jgi:hypothetical protein
MFAEVMIGDMWVPCRIVQTAVGAYFYMYLSTPTPAIFKVPSGGLMLRLRARGKAA